MMRFMVIAADRAPTMAMTIHRICRHDGQSAFAGEAATADKPAPVAGIDAYRAASNAPVSAKGSAKTECSNLIISRMVRMRLWLTGKHRSVSRRVRGGCKERGENF